MLASSFSLETWISTLCNLKTTTKSLLVSLFSQVVFAKTNPFVLV